MRILIALTRPQRRRIQRRLRKTRCRIEALRSRIVLLLAEGRSVAEVAQIAGCVRATVYYTLYRFEDAGEEGLVDGRRAPEARKLTPQVLDRLVAYVERTPRELGWHRSTWTLELMARQLQQETGVALSTGYLGRVLRALGIRRGRPRPALRIPVKGRRAVLNAIDALVASASAGEEVLYADEADLDLNPRIGLTYIRRGHQPLVLTPGKNVKRYLAGALNPRTGHVLYTVGERKHSDLFIGFLEHLSCSYRRARVIHVVLDNYVIHKSKKTQRYLESLGGRIVLHFLPPYSPESNPIERLWKQLHDHVTRNHRHAHIDSLSADVETFLRHARPFPGTRVSTLRLAA